MMRTSEHFRRCVIISAHYPLSSQSVNSPTWDNSSDANLDDALRALRLVGLNLARAKLDALKKPAEHLSLARIVEHHRAHFVLAKAPNDLIHANAHPRLKRAADRVVVGDFVWLDSARGLFETAMPRYSLLKRAAAGERYAEQLLASNVDCAILVCGLDRDYSPRRIERYLALVQSAGVRACVVLSKADQHPDAVQVARELAQRLQNVPVLPLDTRSPQAIVTMRELLQAGETGVLLGSSGAGKSTLSNTLSQLEVMQTGSVRASDGRGRHTTVHRALLCLPWGACLIDSPGLREVKLTGHEDLDADSFTDIAELAMRCKFSDCQHEREPGCAVLAAIENGTLDADRLMSYKKLRAEQQGAKSRSISKPSHGRPLR